MDDRCHLLQKIQAEDFVLYETVLFLNSNPCDKEALAHYHEHRALLAELKKEYALHYGPLTIYDNEDLDEWHWADMPMPWHKEAN